MSHDRAPFYACLRCAAEAGYSDSPDLKARVIAGCPPHTNDERCQAPPLAGAAGEGEKLSDAEREDLFRAAKAADTVLRYRPDTDLNTSMACMLFTAEWTPARALQALAELTTLRARLAEETRAATGLRVELEQRRLRNEQLIRDLLTEFAHDPSDCPAEWAMLKSFDLTAGPFDEPVKGLEPSETAAAGPLLGDEGKEGRSDG